MRVQLLSLLNLFLFIGSLLAILICYKFDDSNMEPYRPPRQKKGTPKPSDISKSSKVYIDKIAKHYSRPWKKQEENYQRMRLQLKISCNGSRNGILTQENTPMGTKLIHQTTMQVTPEIFKTFIKENPFSDKTLDTCSVVGNGGILGNSGCGKMIDSADFVIRCNLAPLETEFEKDVGSKTDLVTANPSIFNIKYHALMGLRRPFVDSLRKYGSSLLLLPAFSASINTAVCLRAVHTIEDFKSPIQPVFLNPQYLESLAQFWRSEGLKERRLSTGLIMVTLALELCKNVHLYGFWPFGNHPYGLYTLTNHYYDDRPVNKYVHSMPAEFDQLLQMHSQGVLRLHLGDCKTGDN
ncbi:unnamed protein product [Oreochromis niloticus]|nr:unnamed protein product [Mustela putorius furo]